MFINQQSCLKILVVSGLFFLATFKETFAENNIEDKMFGNARNQALKQEKFKQNQDHKTKKTNQKLSTNQDLIEKNSLNQSQEIISTLPQVRVIAQKDLQDKTQYNSYSSSSSNRMKTALIDTPASVSIINKNQIRDQNILSIKDAVQYVPGINIQQGEGNRDQITIRGNTSSADFFVDGARDDLQYFRDFYNVENIEILRGPNAVSFGRGSAGGLVNRVNKFAQAKSIKNIDVMIGSFNNQRVQIDVGDKINQFSKDNDNAIRVNAFYEKSDSFRNNVDSQKYGINPTLLLNFSNKTNLKLGYERFVDDRVADRGVPSKNGKVFDTKVSNFFGNANLSYANTKVDNFTGIFNHRFNDNLQIKNLTRFSQNYKFYQNVYAGSAVNSSNQLSISAYNNLTTRDNFTNQTDLNYKFKTYNFKHDSVIGMEITRQDSSNLRKNGIFVDNNSTSLNILADQNVNNSAVNFYKSSSVNDLISEVRVYGIYFQDQIELSKKFQLLAGLRQDRFEINLRNNHLIQKFSRIDSLTSPRLGLVFKPKETISIYGSYSISYLPSAGDQFDSLSASIKSLKPEKFENYEIGSKFEINNKLSINTAIFELNRTNTRANDPNNAGFFILTGESRTRGLEIETKGKITDQLQTILSYNFQDAVIINKTSIANKNAKLPLAPRQKFAWWNKYNFDKNYSIALGFIRQSSQFAGADNAVKINGFSRFDLTGFYQINKLHRLQLEMENIFNSNYVLTAHNNNNLMFGSPRAIKLILRSEF